MDAPPGHLPWLQAFDWHSQAVILDAGADFRSRLNQLASVRGVYTARGTPVEFVPQQALPSDHNYEQHIFNTGQIPTRNNWHDRYNAMIWLNFPLTKARLNVLQAAHISRHGVQPQRGSVRDAITLFDECGLVFVTQHHYLAQALRRFDWPTLLVQERELVQREVSVLVFGHGLLEQLHRPYKALTGHAVVLEMSPRLSLVDLDASLALEFTPQLTKSSFCPLPVLGVPGWWPANEDPAFYDDPQVFRAGRHAQKPPPDPSA